MTKLRSNQRTVPPRRPIARSQPLVDKPIGWVSCEVRQVDSHGQTSRVRISMPRVRFLEESEVGGSA